MHKEITYEWLADKCICALLILSMLSVLNIEVAGFPLYSLFLLVLASVWMIFRIGYMGKAGISFLTVKYLTDIASLAAIAYSVFSAVIKLFGSLDEGAIDFTWNAEVIALAIICLLVSAGVEWKMLYLDLLLYSGLPVAGLYLLTRLKEGWEGGGLEEAFSNSGQMASYFLLIGMVSGWGYCMCRKKTRFLFYSMTAGIGFFALFLNQDVVSLWLMGLFFLAIPVFHRPTASLVKRAMQMFFLYVFMLSNMSLLTGYTQIIREEVSYSLEQSVYLDLLIAVGGLVFFHYWERIPDGTDLERLVLRKMQKAYRFGLKMALLIFGIMAFAGDGWAALPGSTAYRMVKSFAVPLAEATGRNESGFLYCFRVMGVIPGVGLLVLLLLFLDRMYENYTEDKPITDMLILISVFFLAQLLFWNPGIHNGVCYFYLLTTASFYEEEWKHMESIGVHVFDLEMKIQENQI